MHHSHSPSSLAGIYFHSGRKHSSRSTNLLNVDALHWSINQVNTTVIQQSSRKPILSLIFLVKHSALSWRRWIPVETISSQKWYPLRTQAVVDHRSITSSRRPSPRHSNLCSVLLPPRLLVVHRSISLRRPPGRAAPAFGHSFPNKTVQALAPVLPTLLLLMIWMSPYTSSTRGLPPCLYTTVEAIFGVIPSSSWFARTLIFWMEGCTVLVIFPWRSWPWLSIPPGMTQLNMSNVRSENFDDAKAQRIFCCWWPRLTYAGINDHGLHVCTQHDELAASVVTCI